jgi:hypothetical protein
MDSGLHFTTRLVALALAHHAHDGQLPADGIQHSARMSALTGLTASRVRQCLRDLEKARLVSRPPSTTWPSPDTPRPITLTLPAAAGARSEPPHTGESR